MSYHLPLLVTVFVAVAGHCAEQAPPPRPKTIYYHPVTVGTKWVTTYSWGINGERDDTWIVTAAKDGKDGVKIITVGLHVEGKTYPDCVMEVSNKGLFHAEHLGTLMGLFIPKWVLKLPHQEGQTWSGAFPDRIMTAHGPEKVKVPAGEFDCIRSRETIKSPTWDWLSTADLRYLADARCSPS
jgi:hypothetical protein